MKLSRGTALLLCVLFAMCACGVTSCSKKKPAGTSPTAPAVDSDGDGIVDASDQCPTLPGEAQYDGCPWYKMDLCSGSTQYAIGSQKWSNSTPRYYYASSLPAGWQPYVDLASSAWNSVGTRLQIGKLSTVVTADVGLDNRNVVCYGPLEAGILGKTYTWYNTTTNFFIEADIKLNSDEPMSVDTPSHAAGPVNYDVYSVLTHEFGHFCGLGHVADRTHTMYPSTPPDCVIYRTLCNGDVQGLHSLYP